MQIRAERYLLYRWGKVGITAKGYAIKNWNPEFQLLTHNYAVVVTETVVLVLKVYMVVQKVK